MNLNRSFIALVVAGLGCSSAFAQADIAAPIDQAPKNLAIKEVVLPANMVRPTKILKSELEYSADDMKQPATVEPSAATATQPTVTPAAVPQATAKIISQTPGVAGLQAPAVVGGVPEVLQRSAPVSQTVIPVRPGVTEMIPIPSHYLTRIATPFAKPEVKTVNEVEIDVVGSVLFVSPSTDAPIGVFVFDAGDPSSAVTLQLLPQDIPQRDITLNVQGAGRGTVSGSPGQMAGGSSEPYTAGIVTTFADLARGRIPKGYTLTSPRKGEYRCTVPNLNIQLGQVAEGSRFRIAVFLVENVGFNAIHFDEKWCYEQGVAAVSTWPAAVLNPGERTELFVMYHTEQEREQASERPSLLGAR